MHWYGIFRLIDGVPYEGKVKEKKVAARQYNRAKKNGSSAAKIEARWAKICESDEVDKRMVR